MTIGKRNLLQVILFGPIAAGLIRKLVPGQPSAVEAFPLLTCLLLILGLGFFRSKPQGNGFLELATWAWIFLCAAYSIPAFMVNANLGGQALLLSVGAPMIGLAMLRYGSPAELQNNFRVLQIFVFAMVFQLLIGLFMLLFGNEALPIIFRANLIEASIGKEFRIGQPILAGYFTTAPVNSVAALCAFGVASSLFLYHRRVRGAVFWAATMIAMLLVVWMTGRRGVLFASLAILGLTLLIFLLRRGRGKTAVLTVLFVPLILLVTFSFETLNSILFGNRLILLREGGLDLSSRFTDVFLRFVVYWSETAPFGNFTGYASGVGKAFNVRDLENEPAEVGAAMIIAEQGLLGLLLFIVVFIAALVSMISRALRSRQLWIFPLIGTYVSLFVVFFFKENSVLFPGFIGSLIFWALPGIVYRFTSAAACSIQFNNEVFDLD